MRASFFLALLATSCATLADQASRVGEDDGTDECKIEGDDIGNDGVVLRLGARTVTFHDWVSKTGEPNEYVGFTISLTGTNSVGYVVKAGTDRFPSRELTWMHPAGADGGATANGISNVDVCEECTDGSCDGGGGDGSGSGSDGPIL